MKRTKLPTLPQLRKKADHLWSILILLDGTPDGAVDGKARCAVGDCNLPAVSAHHVFHKSMHGRFRYDRRNGIPICRKCHFMERRDPAPVVISAMRYLGCSAFIEFATDVMEARGRGPIVRKRRDFENIITALEEAIAIETIPEVPSGRDPVTV